MMGSPESKDKIQIDVRKGYKKRKNRGSRGKSASPPWTIAMRAQRCHYCAGPGGTIDHVKPISQGGFNVEWNCVPACAPCNNFRGDKPYEEFRMHGWKNRPFALGI